MEILKCNAEYNKVYYVELYNVLHQCKLIRTESSTNIPVYVLDVAHKGVVRVQANRFNHFDYWYRRSKIPSILYESVEDYRNGKPITDEYGSTSNCYNRKFIEPLFKTCSTCNCGGAVYAWRWDGCKAVEYIINTKRVSWTWDAYGFHCELNDLDGYYRTERECIENNKISVITF